MALFWKVSYQWYPFPQERLPVTRDKLMALMSSNTNACSLLINTTVFNSHEEISEVSEPGSLSKWFMSLAEVY